MTWAEAAQILSHRVKGQYTAHHLREHFHNLKRSARIRRGPRVAAYSRRKFPNMTEEEYNSWKERLITETRQAAEWIGEIERREILETTRDNPSTSQVRRRLQRAQALRRLSRKKNIHRAKTQAKIDQINRILLHVDLRRTSIFIEELICLLKPDFDRSKLPQYPDIDFDGLFNNEDVLDEINNSEFLSDLEDENVDMNEIETENETDNDNDNDNQNDNDNESLEDFGEERANSRERLASGGFSSVRRGIDKGKGPMPGTEDEDELESQDEFFDFGV